MEQLSKEQRQIKQLESQINDLELRMNAVFRIMDTMDDKFIKMKRIL